jgi:hypothetical protein
MRYKLVIEHQQKLYNANGYINKHQCAPIEFPVELDTAIGPQLKDDPNAFFDHHFPRDNEQMFLNDDDRQRFIKMYDQNMDGDYITDWYYKEEA